MFEKIWDFLVHALMVLFMPMVCSYFTITESHFMNVSIEKANGLEALSNTLFIPTQYILAGKSAIQEPDGSWKFVQRFDYSSLYWPKVAASVAALPPTLILGSLVKALSLFDEQTRNRFLSLNLHSYSSNLDQYGAMGLEVKPLKDIFIPEGHKRRPGDERNLFYEKQALSDITQLLTLAEIPWWVDCGTFLGAYRYGGAIPWDEDIDIAVLLPDFQNLLSLLAKLDKKKYIVQDWSTRDHPNTYLKVFVRETGKMVDIYHYQIHPKTKTLQYIFSLDSHQFFPEWVKVRERRFTEPVAFETVFPLKRATFDGVEVFIPNDPKKYLQRCYGENLAPAKVYSPTTNNYEKDLSHPYWERLYAH